MVYLFDYDASYDPAIPAAEIEIAAGKSEPRVILRAIVDSGADVTLIPINYLHQARARKGKRAWLRSVTQDRVQVDRYRVWVHIGGLRPLYLHVVADRQGEEAILGRDVLNQLIVTLNGLASTVEISD